MSSADYAKMLVNAPQGVTWYSLNYYPTNSDGQTPTEVGAVYTTFEEAVSGARTKLATEGVGVCFIQQQPGWVVFPLFEPEPS